MFTPELVSGGGGEGGEGGGGGQDRRYRFDRHAPGTVGYYQTPDTPGQFSLRAPADLELNVQGTVVWELPRGFRSEDEVTLKRIGSAPATLVIVGSPNPARTDPNFDPLVGVWFFGGLTVQDVDQNFMNVILVSDGQVTIERSNNPTTDERVSRLSVFANALYLMGPRAQNGDRSSYDHVSDMDDVIDDLESLDALPRGTGIPPSRFSRSLRGSWRDLTP